MFAKKRRFDPAVIERLFAEPYRFDYFQAMRLLERWLRRHGGADEARLAELLRVENSMSLGFPASQLEALRTEPAGPDAGAAVQADALAAIRVTPAFMGLLGGHGVLPAHYTERLADHQARHKDDGPRAFFDLFSTRSLTLFYAAWRKYRLALDADSSDGDRLLPLLLALAGLGNPALQGRLSGPAQGAVLDASLGRAAATLRQRPVSMPQVARVLADYFDRPIRAEQFAGGWYEVPAAQQTMLGGAQAVLGAGALAGTRIWQRDLRVRLVIGPLDRAGFDAFLPHGQAAHALHGLLALCTGVTLEYEIELVLRAADVRPASLASDAASRLGWDSYLVTGPQAEDRNDVCYGLHLA